MLNKKLLIGSTRVPHMVLFNTEGKYGYTGYVSDYGAGSVDRTPFWKIDTFTFVLTGLYYRDNNDRTTFRYTPLQEKDTYPITITVGSISRAFSFKKGWGGSDVVGDPFNLRGQLNKSLPVYFDPPRRLHRSIIPTKRLWRNP